MRSGRGEGEREERERHSERRWRVREKRERQNERREETVRLEVRREVETVREGDEERGKGKTVIGGDER